MTGRKSLTGRAMLSVAVAALLGVLLLTAAGAPEENAQEENAQDADTPEHCPDDQTVKVTCRKEGTLVKKWVCHTQHGRGVNDNQDDAVRKACQPDRE